MEWEKLCGKKEADSFKVEKSYVTKELLHDFFLASVVVFCSAHSVNFHCNSRKTFNFRTWARITRHILAKQPVFHKTFAKFCKKIRTLVEELSHHSLIPDKSTKCVQKSRKNQRATLIFGHNYEQQNSIQFVTFFWESWTSGALSEVHLDKHSRPRTLSVKCLFKPKPIHSVRHAHTLNCASKSINCYNERVCFIVRTW